MDQRKRISVVGSSLCLLTFFAPGSASALTLVQVVGLFYVAVGILVSFTLGIFVVGIGIWIARFNTWPSHRETAIRILEWAVSMLFVLILLVALVYFIQRHSVIALSILGFIAVVAMLILIAVVAAGAKKKKPVAGARGAPPPGGPQRR
ncbi:hypothetical protein A3A40_01275 [Candidatus Kaiserbacteria bacterium RIFCSPLOWO2_01_FULL_54_20]|uniref:Major facilitator superfamily (MFS) profile domain-containing protein n=1 Tax=Candidatus Kaiserbacteria bacterium RIFCSPLOWO2_01_FULL_54_20 TaxID=1798513 RepID=A0A1F6EJU7_9BACT|nr:MAG: hypothetical protein A3A40_01275 [Candidatus Kaiserbacteria bacterium RIFCSPLOWO2_01_FULL_54_20]